MRVGHSTRDVAQAGLRSRMYDVNYDFDNPQNAWINPAGNNEDSITVVAPQPYALPASAGGFVPFPIFDIAFDFDTRRSELAALSGVLGAPDLVFDIDVPPPVPVTGNFVTGSFPTMPLPLRRLNGASGAQLSFNGDAVVHAMRFTFVDKNSSAQTVFLDSGNANPTYQRPELVSRRRCETGGNLAARADRGSCGAEWGWLDGGRSSTSTASASATRRRSRRSVEVASSA